MRSYKIALFLLLASVAVCIAGGNGKFTYQGKLVQGSNLVNDTVAMKLRIHTNDVGGAFVYEESNLVAVVDGYYSFLVGKQPNYGQLKKALKYENAHIEVEVNGEVLSPREPFNPPPVAESAPEVWCVFGQIHTDEAHYNTNYIAQTNLCDAVFLGPNKLVPMFELDPGGDPSYVTCVFPPVHEEKLIREVAFYPQKALHATGSQGGIIRGWSAKVNVRELGTLNIARTLVNGTSISNMPYSAWNTIPLDLPADECVVNPDEFLEVLFYVDTTGEKSHAAAFLRVSVE